MFKNDMLDGVKKVYFIGIGGISMSGLAMILKKQGYIVEGSDISYSNTIETLNSLDIKISIGHSSENITDDIDAVIYTAAVSDDNEELTEAKIKNIKIIPRSELLGYIMNRFKYSIAVSGSHGKTTTTSMLSQILIDCELDPTIAIGGILPSIKSNTKIGESQFFVAEACEYCNSFLSFYPYVAIILNIDYDHVDYFGSIEDVRESFKKFTKNVPREGVLVINGDIENLPQITDGLECNIITFGTNKNCNCDWYAENIVVREDGCYDFSIRKRTTDNRIIDFGRCKISVIGEHNIYNCLSAVATCDFLGIDIKSKLPVLSNFTGAGRRFEYMGNFKNSTIYDDYAHHPTEIKATLSSAKNLNFDKVWCVFQPHTYSRTKALLEDFTQSFDDADVVIVTDIYAAREKKQDGIHSLDLVDRILKRDSNKKVYYIKSFEEIIDFLMKNVSGNDIIITMGAGNINSVGKELIELAGNETNITKKDFKQIVTETLLIDPFIEIGGTVPNPL